MTPDSRRAIPLLLLLAVPVQAQSFAYAGIGLKSDFKVVAARYPHSTPNGEYLRVEPEDIRDHISAIGISGNGPTRRVRIGFETERPGGGLDYPTCNAIEAKLIADYGPPQAIRRFSEEASPRADRLWRSKTEELLLICFKGAGGVFRAEAVQITPMAAPDPPSGAPTQTPAPVDWSLEDSARVAFLQTHGRSYPRGSVIVWAPTDSLDLRWIAAFTDSLAAGVTALRKLIGGPYPWQRAGSRPVRYYLSPGRFVSHADGLGGVFISLSRVRSGKAPYLHEAAHELLAPVPPFYSDEYPDSVKGARAEAAFPLWLIEGLPDYLAQTTAASTGFPEGDVFEIGGLAKADSMCAARLAASEHREEILESIGRRGRLELLFTTERPKVAPVYYACSQSFTSHLVRRIGVPKVVALFPRIPTGTWRQDLETAAGEPLEQLRRRWLRSLGLGR